MKKILATLLIVGSTMALAACAASQSAGNAHGRTAGDGTAPVKYERTFTKAQMK